MSNTTTPRPRTPRRPKTWHGRLLLWLRAVAGRKPMLRGSALLVALIALYVSYGHIYQVTIRYGQTPDVAALMPILIDAMMVVMAHYVTSAKMRLARNLAITGFVLATGASLAANILASPATTGGRMVAGWPALALVLTAAVLHWGDKPAKRKPTVKAPRVAPVAVPAPSNGHGRVRTLAPDTDRWPLAATAYGDR